MESRETRSKLRSASKGMKKKLAKIKIKGAAARTAMKDKAKKTSKRTERKPPKRRLRECFQ